MGQKTYISVILPLKLNWEASYFVPEEMGPVETGDRVLVIFANRKYLGVVSATGITPDVDSKRVMPVLSVERGFRKIGCEEIRLWQSIAEYYLCTIGEVYKTAYTSEKISNEEAHMAALKKIEDRRKRTTDQIESRIAKLAERLDKKELALKKAKEGTKIRLKTEEDIARLKSDIKAAQAAAAAISNKESSVDIKQVTSFDKKIELSAAQGIAYNNIKKGFSEGKPVLLHGITGSGKTEIYIKAAKEALANGRNVLYLVPEIAISRQLENRLEQHFGATLMTYHSGVSSAAKRQIAERIAANRKDTQLNQESGHGNKENLNCGYIVLGTRSSLFLPHHNLGLIIVDEEHDNSYKQDSPAPYYNGRDTALMLSVIHRNCNIILGSATPSLEERYNCLTGKHRLVELTERYHGSDNSDIEIIDTKAERRKNGMIGNFSRKLIAHMESALKNGSQIMILRSRRAWAPLLQCESCGDMPKCPHCNVSLCLHKTDRGEVVACHHCGYRSTYTGLCSKCGRQLKTFGAGTQKIEEEAKSLFPNAEIARLDSDISQNKSHQDQIIKDFTSGKINILIGTQILTKGFDFSKLSLVAVIAADTMLGMQDFRADEKAIQILEQFRGRCGRREDNGLLVIQTSQPEHPVYQSILNNEAAAFNLSLLTERKYFGFPPYSRIIEVVVKDVFEDRAERMSSKLNGILAKTISTDSRNSMTGPYAPAISKVADKHIRILRICLPKDRNLPVQKKNIMDAIRSFEKDNRYTDHISVNVDPS